MTNDPELAVDRIRAYNEMGERITRQSILEYLDKHGEGYSRGLRDSLSLGLSTNRVGRLLRRMESEGLIIGETRRPPFPNRKGGGGMLRRYYWLAPKWKLVTIDEIGDGEWGSYGKKT